ncbi:MAG: hypothetical protein R3Y43_05935 [Alphaproteobacteria bacterium]
MNKTKIITGGIIGLTILLNAGVSLAADSCNVSTSCEDLGYTSSISDCSTRNVKCPFNSSKVACLDEKISNGWNNFSSYAYWLYDGSIAFSIDDVPTSSLATNYIGGIVKKMTSGYSNQYPLDIYLGKISAGTWYSVRATCEEKGGILLGYINSTQESTINTAIQEAKDAGLQIYLSEIDRNETHWEKDFSDTTARIYTGSSGSTANKTSSYPGYCFHRFYLQ